MRVRPASTVACGAWLVAVCVGLGLAFASAPRTPPETSPPIAPSAASATSDPVRYDRDIRPLLSDRCFKCHGPDAAARKAELRLDQFKSATAEMDGEGGYQRIAPGNPEASELWARITSDDPKEQMPPPGSNKRPLSAEEKDLIRRWIAEGARYEPHWSFVRPEKPAIPTVIHAAWCRNDIDPFVLSRLERESVQPSPEADRQTLVRRIFLDLTGLPPTPEEIDGFVNDGSPAAYERMVDRLMTQEPYRSRTAERLATPWLDAARYADTSGIHADNGRQMWAWRDWVLAAYRDNMPFDRFLTEQLAGDLIPNATIDQKIASGFNRNHVTTDEGGAIAEEYLVEYAVDRASTTASVFLGLTMGCARCHDHKFDPISHEEFYSFYAYFNSIDEPGLYTQTPDSNRAYEPFIEVPTPAQREDLARLGQELETLKQQQAKTTPEEEREHAAFLVGFTEEAGVSWLRTNILSAKPESAAVLTPQPDGSILASGANPPTDVHEITLRVDGDTEARLLLLEALEHPSLGHGRVGRADNGNAVLTGIEIESFPNGKPEHAQRHEVQWLWADISQTNGDFHFTNLLLNNRESQRGWAVDAHMRPGDRHLLVMLKDPIGPGSDGAAKDVRVRLRYESSFAQHVFGRIRLTLGSLRDAHKLPLEFSNSWLVGPFPTGGTPNLYAAAFGPENATTIDFSQNFGSGNQFWRYDPNLRDGSLVPLAAGTNTTYIGRLILAPTGQSLPVSLGSDDGFVLYVNGKEVARHEIDRGLMADQDKAEFPLHPGPNLVVMKIVNSGGESGYFFRPIPDESSYPHDLVAALLPAGCQTTQIADRIKQAWRASRSPVYRERQGRVDALARGIADVRAKVPKTMVMKELDTPRPTYVLTRGQYDAPDKAHPVSRGVPAALGQLPVGAPANRLGLAQWLTSRDNPLVARVAVNRLWELFFGAGLVRTSEDFGQQGEWPSHPELLDFLAADFRDSGWDVRRMMRMIVTSATYRQASTFRPELSERDPDNRLLARYPRRRMTAEQVRDEALYVSGLLVEHVGGPSVKTYQPDGLWQEGALPASNTRVFERSKGDDLYRRSLYTYWKRAVPPPSMLVFDAPTREYCVIRRPVTGTPLQALVLWNDPQYVEAARVLAERTLGSPGGDRDRLTLLFRRCTGRHPEPDDLTSLQTALDASRSRYAATPDDASTLLGVGDSPLPADCNKPELAAWTMIASAVMSLYQTTTQQ
jgi:hypothetical protein